MISSVKISELFKNDSRRGQEIFPELIRKLIRLSINKTGKTHFPSGVAIYTTGWDGKVLDNRVEHEFVPLNNSFWELGTTTQALQKIQSDYNKRKEELTEFEKSEYSYVAVTPKIVDSTQVQNFIQKANAEGIFKEICVIDANDLEKWLQKHIDVEIWLLKEFGEKVDSYGIALATADWEFFKNSTTPILSEEIVTAGNQANSGVLIEELNKLENGSIYSVSSRYFGTDYAFYFTIASICLKGDDSLKEKCIVVNNQAALDVVKTFCEDKVIIINFNCFDEKIRKNKNNIYIIFDNYVKANIQLERVEICDFEKALEQNMNYDSSTAYKIAISTDRNFMALRRLLANNPLCKVPNWARLKNKNEMIPLMLMDEIRMNRQCDVEVLKTLVGENYDYYLELLNYWSETKESPLFKYQTTFKLCARKECFDYIQIDIYSLKLQKLEEKTKEILSFINPKYEKKPSVWYVNDGSYKWSESLVNNILDGFVIISTKSYMAQQHFDLFVNDVLNKAKEKYELLLTVAPYLPKLAELSPYSFLKFIRDSIENKEEIVKRFFETKQEGLFFEDAFLDYVLWSVERCLLIKEHSKEAFHVLLDLYYYLNGSQKILDAVIEKFSPIMVTSIPVSLSEKTELLFSRIKKESVEKSRPIIHKLAGGGKLIAVVPVIHSYKIEKPETINFTYEEYYKLQSEALRWLLENSSSNELIQMLKEIFNNMYTMKSSIIQEGLAEIKNKVKNVDDEIKAQLNYQILDAIYDVKKYKNRERLKELLSDLIELFDMTQAKDLFVRYKYVFENDSFPFDHPREYDSNDHTWIEYEQIERKNIREKFIKELIDFYGENVIEKVISIACGKTWSSWEIIYANSKNHMRDASLIINKRDKTALSCYLSWFTHEEIDELIGNQLNENNSDFICMCLPLNEYLINKFENTELERKYWFERSMIWGVCSFKDKVIEKLVSFYPVALLGYYAYQNKVYTYSEGIALLKSLSINANEERFAAKLVNEKYALSAFIDSMDKEYYTDELCKCEFDLLPFLLYDLKDFPIGIKQYFWNNPEALGELLKNLYLQREEIKDHSLGQKMLYEVIGSYGELCFVPIETVSQNKEMLKSWAYRMIGVAKEGTDEKRILKIAVINTLARVLKQPWETIWPVIEIADILEEFACDDFDSKYDVAYTFNSAFLNSRGVRTVGNGSVEFNLSKKYDAYKKYYESTHPITAKALEYISSDYYREGERDKLRSIIG